MADNNAQAGVQGYVVLLMGSTSRALRAEKLLHMAQIPNKLIPVPRHISSDCGVCLRVAKADVPRARRVLEDAKMEIEGVHDVGGGL